MGGWRPLLLKSEREWLLARISEKPDLTLRAVVAELAERGTPAARNCQEFRAGLGMMGAKEPDHAATQRASYS
jgi:transposase